MRLARSIFDTELYLGVLLRRLRPDPFLLGGDWRGGGLQATQDICQWPIVGFLLGSGIADKGITSIIPSSFIVKFRLGCPRAARFPAVLLCDWDTWNKSPLSWIESLRGTVETNIFSPISPEYDPPLLRGDGSFLWSCLLLSSARACFVMRTKVKMNRNKVELV